MSFSLADVDFFIQLIHLLKRYYFDNWVMFKAHNVWRLIKR